jgi:hypothetical protein
VPVLVDSPLVKDPDIVCLRRKSAMKNWRNALNARSGRYQQLCRSDNRWRRRFDRFPVF